MPSGDSREPVTSTSMFSWRVDDAGRRHGILPGDRRQHVVEAELEVGELLRREVQIDLLVLVAIDVDLADVGHAQELGPRGLGEVACLARGEAVIGDAVDDAEDVTELVVEEGPDHALRQRRLYVADLLADLVPDVVEVALGRRFLEVDENGRLAGLGVALDVVEVRGLLELLLEPVGDLLERVGRGSSRPDSLDHHGLHGEVRVFLTAEPLIGKDPRHDADEHEEDDKSAIVDGPFGKIEACHHSTSVSGFTSSPSASELTPAVTTFSPRTVRGSRRPSPHRIRRAGPCVARPCRPCRSPRPAADLRTAVARSAVRSRLPDLRCFRRGRRRPRRAASPAAAKAARPSPDKCPS